MAGSLTETIHDLGKSLSEHCLDGSYDFPRRLCEVLGPQLRPDFRIGFVGVTGEAGAILMEPALLIYTSSSVVTDDSPKYVSSERVAGVIYAVRTLNDASLAEGYKLICQVKALPGHDTDSVAGWHHIPIGMIVACDCEQPLEELADSIATINTQFTSTRWADAISVLSRGLINRVFSASLRCRGYLVYFLGALPRRRAGKSIWLTLSIEKAIGSKSWPSQSLSSLCCSWSGSAKASTRL